MPVPTPTREQLGRVVRRRRHARKTTIEDLAHEAHMHHTYLSGIERGRRNPSWEKLLNLAIAFETPLSAIIKEVEDEADPAHSTTTELSPPGR